MPSSCRPRCPGANNVANHSARRERKPFSSTLCCFAVFLAAAVVPALGQMLARPGWTGHGLDTSPWWEHAIFYRIDSPVNAKDIASRLDALRSLGVDALILPAPELPPPGSNGAMPNLDDLDNLLRQASSHDIRVLLTLHAANANADLSGLARFWLSRGVAGLYIATPPGTTPEQTQALVETVRKSASGALGRRVVLTDFDLAPPDDRDVHPPARSAALARTSRVSGPAVAQLQIDSRLGRLPGLDAASLRPLLVQAIAQPDLLLDPYPDTGVASSGTHRPLAEAMAAIALITHPAALIDSSANLVLEPSLDQPAAPAISEQPATPTPPPAPLPPGVYQPYVPYVPPPPKPRPAVAPKPKPADPLTNWYRQLAVLHHDNAAVRSGSKIFLDFDAQNALVWVNRPASSSPLNPPVIVVCNLSSSPLQLSLADAIKKLNLRGFFLRPLLRSFDAMGAQPLDNITLPPFGVYIGELRL